MMLRCLVVSLALAGAGALQAARSARSSVTMGLAALAKCGVKGSAVVFFYGADDAPSCSKQIAAFDGAAAEFAAAGVAVVGVRNAAGVKAGGPSAFRLVVDEGDAMRTEFGIAKDFFVLGGRETYVLDAAGSIVAVHNNQFDPESHVAVARAAVNALPKAKTGGSPFDGLFGKK